MKPETSTQASEDFRAVIEAARHKKPVDPEVARRIRERSDPIIARLKSQPPTNIAVDLIREVRDE